MAMMLYDCISKAFGEAPHYDNRRRCWLQPDVRSETGRSMTRVDAIASDRRLG